MSAASAPTYGNWIDGQDRPAESGARLVSTRPGTTEVVCEIARGGPADVAAAVTAATSAQPAWRHQRPVERGRVLQRVAEAMRADLDRLADLESAETGKPPVQARFEIEGAASYFEMYAGLVHVRPGEVVDIGPGAHAYTRREPYGVVGVITPWNAPLNQVARSCAPAIAVGNAVVVKPSEFASASTLELARLTAACGLPPGLLDVVTGTGEEVGEAIVRDPGVRKVAFTGSVRAGRAVGRIAADRILPVTLELGGKSPNIVFADADLRAAAAGSVAAFTMNAGQICTAGTRLLVQDDVYEEFAELVVQEAKALVRGRSYGPQTTEAQYEKVLATFEDARGGEAALLTGGRATGEGWLIEPTVYGEVSNDAPLAREEIFGPVVGLIRFTDEDDAVRLANDSEYGLAAGLWTSDVGRAHRVADRLEAGQVFVNGWRAAMIEGPAGGFKGSGFGRERGVEALATYTQPKFVVVSTTG